MPTLLAPTLQARSLHSQVPLLPTAIATGLFLFHLLFNLLDSYGLFRDEFYYLACARHLAWGYVDQPPLSIFLLSLQTSLFGDSLLALRLLPALALAGTVLLTGRMVQHLKGGARAVILACLAVVIAPIYLAMGSYYSMNSLDIFLWSAVAYTLIRLIERPTPTRWLILGFLLGIGLLNKVGFLWLGAGILLGLLFTPLRKQLRTPWPYLAAILAFLLFQPFVVWNFMHDFAHLEFMQQAIAHKYKGITRWDFVSGLLLQLNPVAILLWLPGLYYLLFHPRGKHYRLLGIVFITAFAILFLNGHSKSEYLAPAFPMLFAAGAVWLELQTTNGKKWLFYGYLFFLVLSGAMLAPLARPVLPVESFITYYNFLRVAPDNSEGKELKELPQFYADRFGWKELSATVASVYESLPAAEKQHTGIYTQNYGEAGALEYYHFRQAQPPVISGHNAYWIWGYGHQDLTTLIVVGGDLEDHQQEFGVVEEVAVHQSRYAMPYEDNLPIYLCRKPLVTMEDLWPDTKNFN